MTISEQRKPTPQPTADRQVEMNSKINRLQKEVAGLKSQLTDAERKNMRLGDELRKTSSYLLVAEAEVERLSKIIESGNMDALARYSNTQQESGAKPAPSAVPTAAVNPPSRPVAARSDMYIATVMVDKANLRLGPGTNHSTLMSVSRGTKLAVEGRKENWYRVLAPTGQRAWISSDVVAFVSGPSKNIQIRGYDRNAEKGSGGSIGDPAS